MHGYYGHTLKMVNDKGEWVYAQFHMISDQGTENFTADEAAAAYVFDFLILNPADVSDPTTTDRRIFTSLSRMESESLASPPRRRTDVSFPSWTMKVQVMTEKQAEEAWEQKRINVFDLTHIWPQGDYPLRTIGKFTLNENAKNYFAEVEQVAFNPSHMIPGIEPSNDPVLQSRLFSYPDAHRHRIGANYQQLPVNQPACPFMAGNFQRDGQMAFYNQGSRPNYLSSIEPISFKERAYDLNKVHGKFTGEAVAFLSEIRPEDFNAPRALWQKVYKDDAKDRFIETVSGHMSTVRDKKIVARMMTIFGEVDADLGARLEKATGVKKEGEMATMTFNGTHNGWNKDNKIPANGMKKGGEVVFDNGAPQTAKA